VVLIRYRIMGVIFVKYKIGRVTLLAAVCTGILTAPAYGLEKGDWLGRIGVARVIPNEDSDEIGATGTEVDVKDGTSLGLTLVYMLSPNLGLELLAAVPFEHDLEADGGTLDGVDIGSIKHLPPTLSVQYYFQPNQKVRPYVGAGLNYTAIFDEDVDSELKTALGTDDVDLSLDDSFGLAVEAGVDIDINDSWYFNAALWYIDINTEADLEANGQRVDKFDVDIDPWVGLVGVGTRF
jgi:outer membrane protein